MNSFEKFIETVQNTFTNNYDHISFYVEEWHSIAILTSENILYFIDQREIELTHIDLEIVKDDMYDERFWETITKSIIKGQEYKQ